MTLFVVNLAARPDDTTFVLLLDLNSTCEFNAILLYAFVRTLLTFAIQTVETNVSVHGRRPHVSQTQRLQYIAVIRLLRYHVTLYDLHGKHTVF